MSTGNRVYLPRRLLDEMVAQAKAEAPNECCGLLAGPAPAEQPQGDTRITCRYPLVNAAASPKEFESESRSLIAAARDMRGRGIDIVAIYHSHPTSAPIPSKKDRERNYSADVVNFIISLTSDPPEVRAWWLSGDSYREAEWEVAEGE